MNINKLSCSPEINILTTQQPTISKSNSPIVSVPSNSTNGIDSDVASLSKTLDEYAIKSELPKNKELGVDDRFMIKKHDNATAIDLVNCLFLVHVPEEGDYYKAWHITGADLYMHATPDHQKRYIDFFQNDHCMMIEFKAASGRIESWKKDVKENPGTTYLAGPNADETARKLFNINTSNVTRTEQGPISVTFDFATKTFHP